MPDSTRMLLADRIRRAQPNTTAGQIEQALNASATFGQPHHIVISAYLYTFVAFPIRQNTITYLI